MSVIPNMNTDLVALSVWQFCDGYAGEEWERMKRAAREPRGAGVPDWFVPLDEWEAVEHPIVGWNTSGDESSPVLAGASWRHINSVRDEQGTEVLASCIWDKKRDKVIQWEMPADDDEQTQRDWMGRLRWQLWQAVVDSTLTWLKEHEPEAAEETEA